MRAGLSGASVVLTGVAVYWASRSDATEGDPTRSPKAASKFPGLRTALPVTGARDRPAPSAATGAAAGSPARRWSTPRKRPSRSTPRRNTSYLFDDMHSPQLDRAQLQRALLLREQLTGRPDTADATGGITCRGRRAASRHAAPGRLRDLRRAQGIGPRAFELNDYAGGVSNVTPLNADERKSILRTKLAYKGRFQQLVRDSELLRRT